MPKKKTNSDSKATAEEEAAEQTYLAEQMHVEGASETPEQQQIYEYTMSSNETALISPEDFHKLKLTS